MKTRYFPHFSYKLPSPKALPIIKETDRDFRLCERTTAARMIREARREIRESFAY